jgi:protein involved in polysaccharide export with SLBB domain
MSPNATAPLRTTIILTAIGLVCGCATSHPQANIPPPAPAAETCVASATYGSPADQQANYKIQSGDELSIGFYLNSEFDSDVIVRPDGKISMRLVGETEARGLTPAQLSAGLNELYSNELVQPGVSVTVKNSPSRVVYVQGQVDHPGAVPLQPRLTVLGALAQAGGLTDGANADQIILIRRDACGQPLGQEINLGKILKHGAGAENQADAELLPGDLVVVPRSRIADAGLFVKMYIKDLMPIQPYFTLPLL